MVHSCVPSRQKMLTDPSRKPLSCPKVGGFLSVSEVPDGTAAFHFLNVSVCPIRPCSLISSVCGAQLGRNSNYSQKRDCGRTAFFRDDRQDSRWYAGSRPNCIFSIATFSPDSCVYVPVVLYFSLFSSVKHNWDAPNPRIFGSFSSQRPSGQTGQAVLME